MIRLWICLALIAITGCRGFSYDNDGWYDDYWYDDGIDLSFDDDIKDPAKSTTSENNGVTKTSPAYADVDFLAEDKSDSHEENIKSDGFDGINDYQFEDNRSDLGEGNFDNEAKTTLRDHENNDNKKDIINDSSEKLNTDQTLLSTIVTDNNDGLAKTSTNTTETYDNLAYSSNDSEKKIIEETKSILTEDTDNDFVDVRSDKKHVETDTNELIEETSKLLHDTSDSLEEDATLEEDVDLGDEEIDNEPKSLEDTSKKMQETSEDDTVDKAFNDLMSDIDRLHATWSKLKDYDDENVQSAEIGEEGSYEYEEIDDENFDQLFDNNHNSKTENAHKEQESVEDNVFEKSSKITQTTNTISDPILYLNDALMASEAENRNLVTIQNNESISSTTVPDSKKDSTTQDVPLLSTEAGNKEVSRNATQLDDLSSDEVAELMKDFTAEHLQEILIASTKSEEANYVSLSVDKPVVITSPNYPDHYPTNNTVDWIISGDGLGIELNITDLAINGHVGDYLLIKPGLTDESGSSGLLFSYVLRSERRYRFLDVDKMFIRFEAKQAMQFLRGFSLSLRMIIPRPGAPLPEPEPEPKPAPFPVATLTLNLGGVSFEDFTRVEEQFRLIIADMATLYINTNKINPGINTTIETTQITSKALCFHNWPKFELCTEVRFGVPIVYDDDEYDDDETREARLNEEDLRSMWEFYSQRDPFAVRLRVLGIMEYQVPNDRGTLIVWLVIAGGVVISMAMLAFALWRFSCFADYTRMPVFSDTDSVKEKRNLDLYPTPHQTLPPLYSENDYKWADAKYDDTTKVDVGGYSNRSYMHNDIFDIDSDEDAMTPRDRNSGISPRDIYSV